MSQQIEDIYPLSPAQRGMLFDSLRSPGSGIHVEQMSCVLEGPLGAQALEKAWQHLVDRHPILRTVFAWREQEEPLQVVLRQRPLSLRREDWRELSEEERRQRLEAFLEEDRRAGFRLSKGPLLRLALFRTGEEEHRLVWTHHHILMDGACGPLVLEESLAAYAAFHEGRTPDLPSCRPYGDYVGWLQQRPAGEAEAFWRRNLEGFAAPTPLGREADGASEAAGDRYREGTLRLSAEETAGLQGRARRHRLTVNTLVQGVWALLLSRYSGHDDLVFGATVSSRPPDLEGIDRTIGLFLNTLPVRVRVPAEAAIADWLQEIQERNAEIRQHAHASGEEIRRGCEVPAAEPLFESVLVFESLVPGSRAAAPSEASSEKDPLEIRVDGASGARTNYALTLLAATNPELSMRLIFDRQRLDAAAAERYLEHAGRLLRSLADGGTGSTINTVGALRDSLPTEEIPWVWTVARADQDRPYEPPVTPEEEIVAGIWAELLGLPRVGAGDDFFALGGHSLIAAQAIERLRDAFRVELRLRHLFDTPTVRDLAAEIRRLAKGQEEGEAPEELPQVVPDPEHAHDPFPLTDIQEAYWVGRGGGFELSNVSTHVYTEVESDNLDLPAFEEALGLLIQRHGMLRAVIESDGRQRVLESVPPYRIEVQDLRDLDEEGRQERLQERRREMSHQVLPADRWPLFRICASRLPDDRMRLHIGFDLLIGDGWSWGLMFRELALVYQTGRDDLPPLELTFRDYVLAEHQLRETEAFERARAYWLERLPTLPPAPELPLAADPAALETPRFHRLQDALEAEPWGRLKARGARGGVTPSLVVLTAFAEVLAAWSKHPRFTINMTLFHRLPLHPQVQQIVGDFTSLNMLAVEAGAVESFEERGRRLQNRLWDDLDHRLFSGVRVLRELARQEGGPARAAMPVVFTSTLNLVPEKAGKAKGAIRPPADLESVYSIGQTPQVLLDHQLSEREGELLFNWDVVAEAFPEGMPEAMFEAYCGLLRRLAESPDAWERPVAGLVPEAHLAVQRQANETEAALPQGLLHSGFEARAAEQPDAPAVLAPERSLTYGELERHSRALAHEIRRRGVQRGELVAVVLDKGWEEVVAVLAICRAGAAYLPLDGTLPERRIHHLLERGQVRLALTEATVQDRLAWPETVERLLVEDPPPADVEPLPAAPLEPGDLAYVVFTSGSTGEPKGVMIDHGGALNTLRDLERRFQLSARDRVLGLSALGFDLSVFDIFGTLAFGGALVLPAATASQAPDPAFWARQVERHGVTVWNTVPALLQLLVQWAEERGSAGALASLRLALLSGDWIPVSLPDRIRALAPEVRVISLGGATEASIWSIFFPVEAVDPEWKSIPYGRPLDNQSFHVLDAALSPRPLGVPGELYIGGRGLALGYWRDGARTAAAFLCHPETGERLYRTGDLGRYRAAGTIEFLGREDAQVKIRGHRIELGEIETALERHPRVRSAVAITVGERSEARLVAYVVPETDTAGADAGEEEAESAPVVAGVPGVQGKEPGGHLDLDGLPTVPLVDPVIDAATEEHYRRRRTERIFLNRPVPFAALSHLLASLRQLRSPGRRIRYRYPSAGSLYPLHCFLHVQPGGVEGLDPGAYHYDQKEHRLVRFGDGTVTREYHGVVNQPIFDQAAFSLFLIGQRSAMEPTYKKWTRDFFLLEAGYMGQLLMTEAPEHGIGLCPVGTMDRDPTNAIFGLDEDHMLAHSFLCGPSAIPAGRRPAATGEAVGGEALGRDLRDHLSRHLPAYMVPGDLIFLRSLPLGATGKVDRRALPPPGAAPAARKVEYVAPGSPLEARLAEIWAEVLGVEKVGIHDSFLELGGDSVKGIQMLARVREEGVEVTVRQLFEHQTIAALARQVEAGGSEVATVEAAELAPTEGELEDILDELPDDEEWDD